MAKKSTSNTGFRNGALFCFNCGQSYKMAMPCPVDIAAATMKAFDKSHKNCEQVWTVPVNTNAANQTLQENCIWWLTQGEHGMSSAAIYNWHTKSSLSFPRAETSGAYNTHPQDPDDFRRCYLLLESIPQFKQYDYMENLRHLSPVWDRLVDNWDKLTQMLLQQMETKKPNGMFELMQQIIKE